MEGEAKSGWKAVKKTFEGPETEIAWDFFKRDFIEQFIPDQIKDMKKNEFQLFTQGGLTVAKYANRFIE